MSNLYEKLSDIIKNKNIVLVLSRKGMDTVTGKMASPIFIENNEMLSLPIPIINKNEIKYEEERIIENEIKYSEKYSVINKLNKNFGNQTLHFDPLLDSDMITAKEDVKSKFKPSLGQCGPAATYLLNGFKNITPENTAIIFLFFGRFHFVTDNEYIKKYYSSKPYLNKDLHVIWGYLVVDKIVSLNKEHCKYYSWHPHSTDYYFSNTKITKNNTLIYFK